jgi:carbamoyl-phosphate synthase large subunit
MTESSKTILLSPVGGQAIHGIIKYFKERNFKVLGIDTRQVAIGRFFVDKFFQVPGVKEPSYSDRVLQIMDEEKVDIFISWLDSEIMFWNKKFYSSDIPREFRRVFAFNFRMDIGQFFDKIQFYSLLQKFKFASPKTVRLGETRSISHIGLPAIIKPITGSGSKNTNRVETNKELAYVKSLLVAKFGNLNQFLLQKYIAGDEYTADFFALNNKIVNIVVRKRTEHRGVSLRGEIVQIGAVENLISHFCTTFNVEGLNNLQLIDSGDDFYIIDFNPRPSGTIMFSVHAGVDLIHNLLEQSDGCSITKYDCPRKLKMIRYLTEFYYE